MNSSRASVVFALAAVIIAVAVGAAVPLAIGAYLITSGWTVTGWLFALAGLSLLGGVSTPPEPPPNSELRALISQLQRARHRARQMEPNRYAACEYFRDEVTAILDQYQRRRFDKE